ncbi:MAG: MFS transporter [Muribaculaceae bacterium]|nr:MFS transporter [Muribaculaceae bacterium]
MWTYSVDAIAGHAFNCPSTEKVSGVIVNNQEYVDNYIFDGETMILNKGKLTIAGATINGEFYAGNTIIVNNDTIVKDGLMFSTKGVTKYQVGNSFASAGSIVNIDGKNFNVTDSATTTSAFSQIKDNTTITIAHIAAKEKGSDKYTLEQTSDVKIGKASDLKLKKETILNADSEKYQEAGDWNGVLLAIQGIAAVLWAIILPRFRNRKLGYSVSLIIGAIGFLSIYILNSQYLLAISYALIGCAWAAMLAMPFTILTNALSGNNIGTYLGLFNCTICLPQIIAALVGGTILSLFPIAENGVTQTVFMLMISGLLLVIGALCVWNVKETYGSQASK